MRTWDRGITDRTGIENILDEALVCRIGLLEGNDPGDVPVCFGYGTGSVSIHPAGEGRYLAMLKKNPRCCFGIAILRRGGQGQETLPAGDTLPERDRGGSLQFLQTLQRSSTGSRASCSTTGVAVISSQKAILKRSR